MTAYAYYEAREYDDAIIGRASATSRCIPAAPTRPTRSILIGSSYYDQIPDITRDQARTEKAIDGARRGDRANIRTPNMRSSAKKKIDVARDQLAGKEMLIGRYYLEQQELHRRDQPLQDRGHAVPDHAPRRGGADAADREPIWRSASCSEAQTAAAVLGHNFPDSRWYKDAYTLVKTGGVEPSREQGLLDQQGVQEAGRPDRPRRFPGLVATCRQ